jgi:hypothetical protein
VSGQAVSGGRGHGDREVIKLLMQESPRPLAKVKGGKVRSRLREPGPSQLGYTAPEAEEGKYKLHGGRDIEANIHGSGIE